MFRERDRQAMQSRFDLWSYDDVSRHAETILTRLRDGTMPCDGAWPPAQIDVFQRWVESERRRERSPAAPPPASAPRGRLISEPVLVVESREHLWYLLTEASQLEHMIMCQYLYAMFSLKLGVDEGLTEVQADAVAQWRGVLDGICVDEMLHLALVANLMAAIGA